ncbi:MAG: hypothetical protein SFW65_02175, partial [Alphaproteobacteria bacterium]|nr:hypothetical protein [Alphaproteobacteria bacterium]
VEENLVSLAFSITGIQLTRGNIQKRETAVVTHGSNTAITFVQGEPNSYKEDESGEQAKAIRAMAAQVYAAVKPCLPYAFH